MPSGKFGILPTTPDMKDLLWLAGFYEGEGSAGYTSRGYIRAEVSQDCETTIKWIQEILGGAGSVTRNGPKGWKLQFTGKPAETFLWMILPHMKCPKKIRQACDALGDG